ncbi:MAG: hypothetical protein ABIK68_08585, partial [bacterium]
SLSDGTDLEAVFFSDTRLKCTIPARESGPPSNIIIINKNRKKTESSHSVQIRYLKPAAEILNTFRLEQDSPDRLFTIDGGPFSDLVQAEFRQPNRKMTAAISSVGNNSLAVEISADLEIGVWDLWIANDQYSETIVKNALEILPAVPVPHIASLALRDGQPGTDPVLTVKGSGFRKGTIILLNEDFHGRYETHFISEELLELTLPLSSTGVFTVEAFTRDDRKSTFKDGLIVDPFPEILSVTPLRLDPGKAAFFIIKGSGFTHDSQVYLDDSSDLFSSRKLSTILISPILLQCSVPAMESGPISNLVVENQWGRKVELAECIQIRHQTPVLNTIVPVAIEKDSTERTFTITGGPFAATVSCILYRNYQKINLKSSE